ncbi:hypothetical protein B7463_g11212, partial [Scytalidium lignicola]
MSTVRVEQNAPPSPPPEKTAATVQVHALTAGHLTLPENHFVHPASDLARSTVPSLAFLIQHENLENGKKTRIVFDLGLRRDLERYPEPIQRHAATRQPISTDPDIVKSLAAGGLTPNDIDYVMYSHVHWDHIGEPRDFTRSTFIIGPGSMDLLQGTSSSLRGSHSHFEQDLLPQSRTFELNPTSIKKELNNHKILTVDQPGVPNFQRPWVSYLNLPSTIDLFQDGSLYIVDAPGHLPGHINLLARTGPEESVYLAGDACHDRRILRKEKTIGTWCDSEGFTCCIHSNREAAEQTIERIRGLENGGIEVIFAHDIEWEWNPENRSRFWGSG